MLTTDLSLRFDSAYEKISRRFLEYPEEFDLAFAKAWFKLTHRDMGPKSTYLGPEIPENEFVWQDPLPKVDYKLVSSEKIEILKKEILNSGLKNNELIETAWSSASTFRISDRRGGANGARIRLKPQIDWDCNNPTQLKKVLATLKKIQSDFNSESVKISMADLIVLAGNTAIENAIKKAGYDFKVPFNYGRTDAVQENTDLKSFNYLEPIADGFKNYHKTDYILTAEQLLVDKAQQLCLSAPEMTVLIGGLRVLNANYEENNMGVLTKNPGKLNNAFFVNLLNMNTKWQLKDGSKNEYEGLDRNSNELKWRASRADLIFGSNSELRAICEVYASDDYQEKFILDFIKTWNKVMNLDRFKS